MITNIKNFLNGTASTMNAMARMADLAGKHTPDILWLEEQPLHRLFIYDEHMNQHRSHHLILNQSKFLYTAFTRPGYAVWKKNLGPLSQAVALLAKPSDTWAPPAKIKGQLYAVTTELIKELDKLKENGLQFRRRRTTILVPFRHSYSSEVYRRESLDEETFQKRRVSVLTEPETEAVEAWMYFGRQEYWADQLDGGYLCKPVRRFEQFASAYYHFTLMEYRD